ncbi:MAG TPA: indole-3-glycerol phosphate synthase TrpC [Candidatus Brocadiia bacterium]|nr:indole-3-glycerol phosphate synthase TrpC [Candidatus Brocadiia bacterium]
MDILDRICANTRIELESRKGMVPLATLRDRCGAAEPCRGFARALRDAPGVALIAELKKASPSAGLIRRDFDPATIARAYEDGGASAMSVLTDSKFFQGDLAYLRVVRNEVGLPLLRKDFTLDEYQVYEARAAGADAILLIVACLDDAQLRGLRELAESLGMDALVEVHDRGEMARAQDSGAELIGINNRNLRTFEVDLRASIELAALAPVGAALVSESGIKNTEDLAFLGKAGVKAVLVGETLMRAPDMRSAVESLLASQRNKPTS